METTRLALLRDGTAAGCFTLRAHETHVVVVEPNGHAFSYVGPQGRASRHLTPTLLSVQRALVRTTIEFRNRFALCLGAETDAVAPYAHSSLWGPNDHAASPPPKMVRRRRRRTRRRDGDEDEDDAVAVGWPRMATYSTRAFWDDVAHRFEVASLDGAARVQLHASGKMAHATYLLKVNGQRDSSDPEDHECVWVEQRFPPSAAPACFAFAVQLLERARIARGSDADQFSVGGSGREQTAFALPRNGALDNNVRPTFRPLSDPPPTTALSKTEEISVESVTWWIKGMSRSLDRLVVAERAGGIDSIVNRRDVDSDKLPTVLIMNSSDAGDAGGSLIECDRHFFRAFDARGGVAQQFTVETMPLALRAFNSDFQRTRASLLHAAELFDATCHALPFDPPAHRLPVAPAPAPVTVLEDLSNDVGRFRAFSDGRVRVVFADRTILQVSPSEFADECCFTYRDGTTGTCTSDSASPHQLRYVKVAMDFAQWAFATPTQRFTRHQLQLEQQEMVASELHKITIRQELNHNSVVASTRGMAWQDPTTETVPPPLSREAVAQLQRETQLHMTHVQTLLLRNDRSTHGD